MSEPQETETERSIYLAGPIEADDSPRSWRDDLRERFPEVDWIDPMDWQDEWEEDPSAVWEREMETVRNNAVLVCNIGDEAPRTTGTHHEIREALNHGQPVGIVPEGTVSQVYREIEDVWIYDGVKHAVADLTAAEIADDGLRADGGIDSEHRVREPGFDGKVRESTREGSGKDVEMLAIEEFETARCGGLGGEVVETKVARERAKVREEHAYDVMLALADYLGYEVQGR